MSDHSPIFISINFISDVVRGRYGWKFNNSLLTDDKFPTDMKNHLQSINVELDSFENPHIKWEYLKYEARKFSIAFSKNKNSEEMRLKAYHENVIKRYTATENRPPDSDYAESKAFMESHFDKKTRGAILRSKCQYHEHNEKSSKFFLNLEKKER